MKYFFVKNKSMVYMTKEDGVVNVGKISLEQKCINFWFESSPGLHFTDMTIEDDNRIILHINDGECRYVDL
jgi:hypothetical protein